MEELDRTQQQELVAHLRGCMQGERPMEHTGAPHFRPGEKYQTSASDEQFEREMRTGLFRGAFFRSVIWGATPALMFNIPFFRNSFLFRNSKTPVPAILICGFLGYGKGILEGSNEYAKARFMLEDSPISKETRWKVHEMKPNHSWLRGFEHEFQNQNRRAQMQDNRRGGRFDRDYRGRYDRYEDRRGGGFEDEGRGGFDSAEDQFSMDEWFNNGSEGGRIPQNHDDEPPRANPYINERGNRFREDAPMSKGEQYRQDRREFDRRRDDRSSRDEEDTAYSSRRSYSRDPPRGSVYGQRDEDFVTQADFETSDDKFVSGRPNRDGW